MRAILPANQAALLGSVIFPRDFLEITARDRVTGDPIIERLWSDRFDTTASVVDPDTGIAFSAAFQGASGLVEADDILFVSNLTVQDLEIKFSAYGVDTDRLFRLYDPQHAPVRIWRGFLNIETGVLVAPAEPLFIGEIDEIDLPTGSEGEEVYASVRCVSSQELTRASMLTSSDAAQRVRDPTDAFFSDAASVGDWQLWWGQAKQAIAADTVSQRNADAAARIRTIG